MGDAAQEVAAQLFVLGADPGLGAFPGQAGPLHGQGDLGGHGHQEAQAVRRHGGQERQNALGPLGAGQGQHEAAGLGQGLGAVPRRHARVQGGLGGPQDLRGEAGFRIVQPALAVAEQHRQGDFQLLAQVGFHPQADGGHRSPFGQHLAQAVEGAGVAFLLQGQAGLGADALHQAQDDPADPEHHREGADVLHVGEHEAVARFDEAIVQGQDAQHRGGQGRPAAELEGRHGDAEHVEHHHVGQAQVVVHHEAQAGGQGHHADGHPQLAQVTPSTHAFPGRPFRWVRGGTGDLRWEAGHGPSLRHRTEMRCPILSREAHFAIRLTSSRAKLVVRPLEKSEATKDSWTFWPR